MLFQSAIALVSLFALQVTADLFPAWHLDVLPLLVEERLDPIVSPNAAASHMHVVVGGSNFGAAYNYDDYSDSSCTTSSVTIDKSNYWMPTLYWINDNGKSFTPLTSFHRFYYFLSRANPDIPLSPFPKGLRMLIGDPNAKADTGAIVFTCQPNADLSTGNVRQSHFNFNQSCPYGVKIEATFNPCWDGVNLYKEDGSHMAPTLGAVDVRRGNCPITHPVKVPQIMLEYTFRPSEWAPGVALAGNLAFANGDTTGFGGHADFVNGWDIDILASALNDTTCAGGTNHIPIPYCPVLGAHYSEDAAWACKPAKGTLNEPGSTSGNVDLVPVATLPGCNPLWSSGPKPTCTPSRTEPSVTSFTGTDGSLTVPVAEQKNIVLPSGPDYQDYTCLGLGLGSDALMLTGGMDYYDTALNRDTCTQVCAKGGYPYAGMGMRQGRYSCQCGMGLAADTYYAEGYCVNSCPGDSTQHCGATNAFNILYTPTPTNATSGSTGGYKGCYTSPSPASAGLEGASTYSFTSYSLTVDMCLQACADQGTAWGAVTMGKTCFCGQNITVGTGKWIVDSACNQACLGNSSQTCGSTTALAVYDVAMAGYSKASVSASGYKGCFQDPSRNGLSNYSFALTTMTTDQCTYACAQLGYSLAGLWYGNSCRCGNSWTGGTVYPDSGCTTPCSGNSTQDCGGNQLTALYDATVGNVSVLAAQAAYPGILGCYSGKGLGSASASQAGMNSTFCRQGCQEMGYSVAAVSGDSCTCGNNTTAMSQVQPGACTTPCSGAASEKCGGYYLWSTYAVSGVTPPPAEGLNWQGCYQDSSSRALSAYSYSAASMTPSVCRATCKGKGYSLAGLSGNLCMCDSTVHVSSGAGILLPNWACTTMCSGDSTQRCGGSWRTSIYGTAAVVATTVSTNSTNTANAVTGPAAADAYASGTANCYADISTLSGPSYTSTYMTVDTCLSWCHSQNTTYAGLINGNKCVCGNTKPSNLAPEATCNVACISDSTKMCGGSGLANVYTIATATYTDPLASTGYLGCWTDSSTRFLPSATFSSTSMTNPMCGANCLAQGYPYYGTESGNECHCAGKPASSGYFGYRVADSECGTKCRGNSSSSCGGSWRQSVYQSDSSWSTTKSSTTADGQGFIGAYGLGSFVSSATIKYTSNTAMTPTFCRRYCNVNGFTIAGVSGGNLCSCGVSSTLGVRVTDSAPNIACTGDSTQVCGDLYIVSTFSATDAVAPKGYPANYVGCFQDSSSRVLSGYTQTSKALTASACAAICSAKGYKIYGTESSTSCFCGATYQTSLMITDDQCGYACSGNSTEMCGGSWRLSIYDPSGANVVSATATATTAISSVASNTSTVIAKISSTNIANKSSSTVGPSPATSSSSTATHAVTLATAIAPSSVTNTTGSSVKQSANTTSTMTTNRTSSVTSSPTSIAPSSVTNTTGSSVQQSANTTSTTTTNKTSSVTSSPTSSRASSSQATSPSSLYSVISGTSTGTAGTSTTSSPVTSTKSTAAATSSSSIASSSNVVYVGCFTSQLSTVSATMMTNYLTVENCGAWCAANRFVYSVLSNGDTCACGNSISNFVKQSTDSVCSTTCSGASDLTCGGSTGMAIYQSNLNAQGKRGSTHSFGERSLGNHVHEMPRHRRARRG